MAFTITPLNETFNGMEMNLSLFLLLCLIYILIANINFWTKFLTSWLIASLFMATRFEAPYMLMALLVGCLLSQRAEPRCPSPRFMSALFIASLCSFGAMELWRHNTFGSWMPNTAYAKLWWPYQESRTWHNLLTNRGDATTEILVVLFSPLLLAFWLITPKFAAFRGRLSRINHLILTLSFAAFLFGIVFGKNLGHRGRMIETLLPFLVILLVVLITTTSSNRSELRLALVVIATLHFGLWCVDAYLLAHRERGQPINRFESEGLASDDVRRYLHRDTLTIMIPDVGGPALCCKRLRILDIALLTNPILAREGYSHFRAYFALNRPDIVVAHEVWAEATRVYSDDLLNDYSLVQARETRLFVRNDLYAQLIALRAGELHRVVDLPICLGRSAADQDYSRSKGLCLLLSD
jgi:hypothetical protein